MDPMYNAVKTAALISSAPKAARYFEKDKGRAGKSGELSKENGRARPEKVTQTSPNCESRA